MPVNRLSGLTNKFAPRRARRRRHEMPTVFEREAKAVSAVLAELHQVFGQNLLATVPPTVHDMPPGLHVPVHTMV